MAHREPKCVVDRREVADDGKAGRGQLQRARLSRVAGSVHGRDRGARAQRVGADRELALLAGRVVVGDDRGAARVQPERGRDPDVPRRGDLGDGGRGAGRVVANQDLEVAPVQVEVADDGCAARIELHRVADAPIHVEGGVDDRGVGRRCEGGQRKCPKPGPAGDARPDRFRADQRTLPVLFFVQGGRSDSLRGDPDPVRRRTRDVSRALSGGCAAKRNRDAERNENARARRAFSGRRQALRRTAPSAPRSAS